MQLVAYEWFVAGADTGSPERVRSETASREVASREVLEGMYVQLLHTLHQIGYTDAQRQGSADTLFRSLFDRADLSAREVAALRGLWRQVLWAARNTDSRDSADVDTP